MNARLRPLFVVSAMLSLAGCDKPTPPAAVAPVVTETDTQLAEANDALQRQAMEIETKTALMDQQFAEMEQTLKEHENAGLRGSLAALKQQNEALRAQADVTRRQSDAITQRIAAIPQSNLAPQPVVLSDYSLFYERLAPYGRWLEVNGYGYCWLPTITVMGWRPYVDGCWVWSPLGWAWQSNEPFGWATYHYGRWLNLVGYGWVWVPGNEWAPAWVAWRQSLDCVGWAPLPPEPGICTGVYRDCDSRYGLGPTSYTFITTNQFVSASYINVYTPVTRQTTIFQRSVNVTQIVPRTGHGHSFVNQGGPPRAQMEHACGQPVPQRQVQTMHADQVPTQQHQRGGHREAAAPVAMVELPAVTSGAPARHPDVREHVQRPALVSSFEGVPQHVATEIRQTIDQEKEIAAVQQQPVHGRIPHGSPRHPVEASAVVHVPSVLNAPPQETAAVQQQPSHGHMPYGIPPHSVDAPAVVHALPQEALRPATAPENPVAASVIAPIAAMPVTAADPAAGAAVEQTRSAMPVAVTPPTRGMPPEHRGVHHRAPAALPTAPSAPPVMPAVVETKAAGPAVVAAPPAAMPQVPVDPASADAVSESVRRHAAEEQAQGAAMQHRQRRELEEHAMAEKTAAEQATTAAVAEKARQQAEAAAAQQQRMAAEQAAAIQQQEQAAQQQRVATERMANEQAAAEAARAQQAQAEAAALQHQQDEVRRATEEQQMRAQQEAAQMAQRQAEEQARRQQEAEMQRAQEQARQEQMRAQQEAAQRAAQEMAQRQAEEQARRSQEEAQRAAAEAAQRAAAEAARNQPQPAPGS